MGCAGNEKNNPNLNDYSDGCGHERCFFLPGHGKGKMIAGGGGDDGTGCFVCHTEKDGS